ncbi:hypothetical protein ACG2LH_00770 [Zhouia sp. PK063]|uniref:hypothetical protein n=1 Tax=Zhouia sp. PK063 TaxID=3373602 RepID=UPI0037BB9DD1
MKAKLIFSILLPSIILFIISYLLDMKFLTSSPAYLMPLFFGFVLGIFNYKFYKRKIYFNQAIQVALISIIISYICFIIALFSFPLLTKIINLLVENPSKIFRGEQISDLSLFLSVYLLTPIYVILSFKSIFKYPKSRTTIIIFVITLITFLLLGYLTYYIDKAYLLWMSIMIFFIELIIHQKEIN